MTSSPAPPQTMSLPRLAKIASSPGPPQITSRPGVPRRTSAPAVPTIVACRPWQRCTSSSPLPAAAACAATRPRATKDDNSAARVLPWPRPTTRAAYEGWLGEAERGVDGDVVHADALGYRRVGHLPAR